MPFGIDLGTTNSSVAWADSTGAVYSLKVRRGPKDPFDAVESSLVLDPEGDPVIGHTAVDAWKNRPGSTLLRSFKLRLDKQRLRQGIFRYEDVPTHEYDWVNQCMRYARTGSWIPLEYDEYSLGEVLGATSLLLRQLLTSVEIEPDPGLTPASSRSALDRLLGRRATGASVSTPATVTAEANERLYIGIPVSFGPTARRRLLSALVASGQFGTGPDAYARVLERCRLVYEPLALVSTLTQTLLDRQNVLVFDYGGGTLDLAVLDVEPDEHGVRVRELALGGLEKAGDWLDDVFRSTVLERRPRLRERYEEQVRHGGFDEAIANGEFVKAKVDLSAAEETRLLLFDEVVRREEFEGAISASVDEAITAVDACLERAGLRPQDVGAVKLTGGSSLIPLVQARLRGRFPHLDDLSFEAGVPGDRGSWRDALTGVSRGLARFGFLDAFETTSPCDYSVVVPGIPGSTICLERGAPDTAELPAAPSVPVSVDNDGPASFAVYSSLVRDAYCAGLADLRLPPGTTEVEVRVAASRDRFTPAFAVYLPGASDPVAVYDLDRMARERPEDLAAFLAGDYEWLPAATHVERAFLTRPLRLGDFVEWRVNGSYRRGKIFRIREINSGDDVDEMVGFDPSPYVLYAAREENGVVTFGTTTPGSWRIGDVRLA
jgi:Hsp70 protein